MAEALREGKGRLSAQQDAMLEQMISEKLTAISNRCTMYAAVWLLVKTVNNNYADSEI